MSCFLSIFTHTIITLKILNETEALLWEYGLKINASSKRAKKFAFI